jgi:hypothetical protein
LNVRTSQPTAPPSSAAAQLGLYQGDWWFTPHGQIAASEYLLILKFRDLDPTRFRSGNGDLIASMQRV